MPEFPPSPVSPRELIEKYLPAAFAAATTRPELTAGLTLALAIQVLINMGVVLGLLPTKGLALPFLSYGNSSMLATLATVGMLMALSREVRER